MAPQFNDHSYVNDRGHLQIEGWDCMDLADRFGTPLYVMSENQIRHNYREIWRAFSSRYPKVLIAYGSKANNSLAVRRILTLEGAGADCFGPGELLISLKAGVDPDKIVLNGSNKSEDELRTAIQTGVNINVDNLEELQIITDLAVEIGVTARVNIRIKPPHPELEDKFVVDYRYNPPKISIARWVRGHKFGMPLEEAFEACRIALELKKVQLLGVHYHLKGQTSNTEYFEIMIRDVMSFVGQIYRELGWSPRQLDLGGGFSFGRPEGYGPKGRDREVPTIDRYAEAMTRELKNEIEKLGISPPLLILESGRYIVANAGLLLGRVGAVKRDSQGKTWVHVDASTNHLMRVRTSAWYYHILVASKANAKPDTVVDVVGPLCDAADILGGGRRLPSVRRGDLIAVLDTGAYVEVTGCTFNTYPRPATVLVQNGEAEVITERETIKDLLAKHHVPERLLGEQVKEHLG